MTKNTKFYKAKVEGSDDTIIYRTLTVKELGIVNGIQNPAYKNELTAKLGITEGYSTDLHYTAINQIGIDILNKSTEIMTDKDLFDIVVDTYRASVQDDTTLELIKHILTVMPNLSIQYLLDQTYADLIELVCFCENVSGKKIFQRKSFTQPPMPADPFQDNSSKTLNLQGVDHTLSPIQEFDGKKYLHEDKEKSLVDKMKEDQKFFKD